MAVVSLTQEEYTPNTLQNDQAECYLIADTWRFKSKMRWSDHDGINI